MNDRKVRKHKYEYKINKLRMMIERKVGHHVTLKRSTTGALEIPQEVLAKIPNVNQ